ncbi:MAG TPA: hypothetical protein VMX77_00505 [Candidatus Bathyarchaeia archaeon]|nr:hypothetical protein [Candidatus Bathyarchaeia archaeon]
MPEEPPFKKKKKKLGYRTPDRFRRTTFRKKREVVGRPRSLGGHR